MAVDAFDFEKSPLVCHRHFLASCIGLVRQPIDQLLARFPSEFAKDRLRTYRAAPDNDRGGHFSGIRRMGPVPLLFLRQRAVNEAWPDSGARQFGISSPPGRARISAQGWRPRCERCAIWIRRRWRASTRWTCTALGSARSRRSRAVAGGADSGCNRAIARSFTRCSVAVRPPPSMPLRFGFARRRAPATSSATGSRYPDSASSAGAPGHRSGRRADRGRAPWRSRSGW